MIVILRKMTLLSSTSVRLWIRLWASLDRGERGRLYIVAGVTVLSSVATALTPALIGWFVDSMFRDGTMVPLVAALPSLLLLALVALLIGTTTLIRHQQLHTVTTSMTARTRRLIYGSMLRWDLRRFIHQSKGAAYGRINRSIEGAERLIMLGIADLGPAIMVTVFSGVVAVMQYGALALIMLIVVPTGFVLVAWQMSSQDGIRVRLMQDKEAIDAEVSSVMAGAEVVRTMAAETYFDEQVGRRVAALRETERAHHFAMSRFDAAKLVNETVWLLATLLASTALGGLSTAGQLAGIVLLYAAITRPLRDLHRVLDESAEAALHTANLYADLAIPFDASYEPSERPVATTQASPAIELRDVEYTPPGASSHVLRGISATVERGERLGIVGASGCGKSTLLKLIARLTHDYQGRIFIQGRDLQNIGRADLVSLLGYVGQHAQLFPRTVRENIVLGRGGITNEDLVEACRRANIYDDIIAMEDGFDTQVGQLGGRLSGGQAQRICLARALLIAPPILLLDEPTSALDNRSQATIQQTIDELEGITVVMVAHRVDTLADFDRILVVADGRIAEQGTYAELSNQGGLFSDMLLHRKTD